MQYTMTTIIPQILIYKLQEKNYFAKLNVAEIKKQQTSHKLKIPFKKKVWFGKICKGNY